MRKKEEKFQVNSDILSNFATTANFGEKGGQSKRKPKGKKKEKNILSKIFEPIT